MEPIRLQKFFTDCGILSRRAAEEEIRAGRVLVNGAPAALGCKIDPARDRVEYRGRTLALPRGGQHYLMLNKPRGVVTTLRDEKGRPCVADLVVSFPARVYPIGRLDMDSDGLLLLTDDGALSARLTHPRHEIPKYYRVETAGAVLPEQLERLNGSFLFDGYRTRPARVRAERADASRTVLSFELREGRNRQIRRMCEAVGLRVLRLTRTAVGELRLGSLPPGRWRMLTGEEIAYLKGADKPHDHRQAH